MSALVAPPPCPVVARAVREAARVEAGAVRAWEPLPPAPDGWAWRGAMLWREATEGAARGRRWTIGRRTEWDGRWQLLVWRDGRGHMVREGDTAEGIAEWAGLVVAAEALEAALGDWAARYAAGLALEALVSGWARVDGARGGG